MAKIFVSLILALELFANLSRSIEYTHLDAEDTKYTKNDLYSEYENALLNDKLELRSQLINPLIVNGENAAESEANFIVQVRAEITSTSFGLCGGSLLNACTVLTAAHCIHRQQKLLETEKVTIRYGTKKLNYSEYADIKPKSMHVHYRYQSGQNDIAIIKLSKPVEPCSHVSFVKFDQKDIIKGNESVTIYGWGRTSAEGPRANLLQKLEEKTLSQSDCSKLGIKQNVICAHSEIGNACKGDSGGPMIYRNLLVGVGFRVQAGCKPGDFNLYTRVSSYVRFIKKYMRNNINC